jgi:hypothetical protein
VRGERDLAELGPVDPHACAALGTMEPVMLAVAELDGDPEPEILVNDDYVGLFALETDLSIKWTWSLGTRYGIYYPFSVADLDNDGLHEVLVHADEDLRVLGPDGVERTAVNIADDWYGCATSQPIVADIDGDGLAEILLADQDLVVVTNGDGGWTLPEADHPWSGLDRFPGDRTVDGGVPAPTAWWTDPGQNVWQGLPAGGVGTADLGVDIVDVCVDDCEGDAVVTVQVANSGMAAVVEAMTVEVWSIDSAELLATTELPPTLGAGVTRSVVVEVPAARLVEGRDSLCP